MQFSKPQLPVSVLAAALCPQYVLARPCIDPPHCSLRRLRGSNLALLLEVAAWEMNTWEVATWEIFTWEVALGKCTFGKVK